MSNAKGEFQVKLSEEPMGDVPLGRMSIDKQFHGDLEAASKGMMLSAASSVQGSAGYVAMERVTGVLDGKAGSFVLQHCGTMTRGTPQLTVSVVPDSGTEELAGLSGTMMIHITGGKHAYEFEYMLSI